MTNRIEYYKQPYVLMALTELCWNREFTTIGKYSDGEARFGRTVRAISLTDAYLLKRIKERLIQFDQAHEDKNKIWFFNLYRSVSSYKEIPKFTYNPKLRSEATKKWYGSADQYKATKGYDVFLDIDLNKNDIAKKEVWQQALEVLNRIKELLDKTQTPYQIFFSGTKGFHILIPHRALPKGLNFQFKTNYKNTYFAYAGKLVEQIKDKLDIHEYNDGKGFVDLANNGSPSKLMKLPLSISECDRVVLPLHDKDIKRFELRMTDIDEVMENINIRKLKDLQYFMRYKNISNKKAQENLQEFVKILNRRRRK